MPELVEGSLSIFLDHVAILQEFEFSISIYKANLCPVFRHWSRTRNLAWIMLYSICILIRWCFQLFVQISFKTRLLGRKYCCREALLGKLFQRKDLSTDFKKFKHSHLMKYPILLHCIVFRMYLCVYRSVDGLPKMLSLFFLFRVRYKICTRCCQEALERTKFDRLTLPRYTTIQIPVT